MALDDHAEVRMDDAECIAEVDRDEEGLVDVHVGHHVGEVDVDRLG